MNLYNLFESVFEVRRSTGLNEFAPQPGSDSSNYFKELASAWYNGAYDSGSLQKGIKTNQDIERLLQRGIVAPDGKTRKYNIDYNSDFDGVIIFSDDYYEHGDESGELDSRTGRPWGPYDHMEFKDEELDEGVAEAVHPDVVSKNYFNEPTKNVRIGDFEFNARTFTGGLGTPNARGLQIRAYDPKLPKDSLSIGSADFIVKSDKKGRQWLESDDTEVNDEYRGKGIAAMMYAFAKSLGNDIERSPYQSKAGSTMWNKWGKDAEHLVGEQGVAEDKSRAMDQTAQRLTDPTDGKTAKLRAAGDRRREEQLKSRDIAKKNNESQEQGVAEGLNEFASAGSGDGGDDGFSEETLKRLAAQWYNGDEDPRVERTLMAAGWEIGQDEGYDDEPGVFVVQAGDINGNSYISWSADDLRTMLEDWSTKYKRSINCSHPKGFSQRAHCAGRKKHNESLEYEMVCPDCGVSEDLHKWFKEKWVRFGPDGKIRGACARGDDSEGKPKCLPQAKANALGKKGRQYAASKKRREDPNPERSGKAINVNTKKKVKPDVSEDQLDELKCWPGYRRVQGVPSGAPGSCKKKTREEREKCPECGGPIFSELLINEKKDSCYYKVKSRYKVWPSAYASGALVKCRKKGASNWGTKSKNTESSSLKEVRIIDPGKVNVYFSPDKTSRARRIVAQNISTKAADLIIDKIAEKYHQKPEDFYVVPVGPEPYRITNESNKFENRLYYNVIGTPDKKLRSTFGMRKDRNGWFLSENVDKRKQLAAFRAFGTPKLKEYNLAAFSGSAAIKGEDNVISPVGSGRKGK